MLSGRRRRSAADRAASHLASRHWWRPTATTLAVPRGGSLCPPNGSAFVAGGPPASGTAELLWGARPQAGTEIPPTPHEPGGGPGGVPGGPPVASVPTP